MKESAFLRPTDMNPSIGSPPVAERREHRQSFHGRSWNDPYFWLRDPGYPVVTAEAVLDYLKAENAYFEAAFEPHQDLVDRVFAEIRGRVKEDDASVPVRDGMWYFQHRYDVGEEYPRYYRKQVGGGEWEVFLDQPKLAAGHDYFRVGGLDMTRDGSLLAYSIDTEGSERYRMQVRDLRSGKPYSYEIANTISNPVWLDDNKTFLYIVLSDEWRPYQIKMHVVGADPADDRLLYEEKDTGFFVDVDLSQDRKLIILSTSDHVTSEVYIVPATEPTRQPRLVSGRREHHEYEVDHAAGRLYIRTNDRHKNFRVVRASYDEPGEAHWEEVVPPSDDTYIRGFTPFERFLAIEERASAVDGIRVVSHNGDSHGVAFPESSFTAFLGTNPEADVDAIRIGYQSMVTPPTVFDYDVNRRTLETRKVQEIPSGYDASLYVTERLVATARDGEKVPISILYRRGFPKDGSGFVHLHGYGAYGYGQMPTFSISQLSLLDRGFAFAIAHIRGGDEMGYRWYEDGKLDKRTNTFNDFVDAARHLCDGGYTAPGRICASGGSAGGELMGAVSNMAADLFRAIVAHVPFVDVLNTMLDDTLPLTPTEWPEWGNPIEDPEVFEYIRSYSPYDNVDAKDYPPMLITAGLADPRVTYWEPAKWTAKLRAMKTDGNVLLLKTNMGAGHAGKSGRFKSLYETAEYMTFFLLAAGKTGSD